MRRFLSTQIIIAALFTLPLNGPRANATDCMTALRALRDKPVLQGIAYQLSSSDPEERATGVASYRGLPKRDQARIFKEVATLISGELAAQLVPQAKARPKVVSPAVPTFKRLIPQLKASLEYLSKMKEVFVEELDARIGQNYTPEHFQRSENEAREALQAWVTANPPPDPSIIPGNLPEMTFDRLTSQTFAYSTTLALAKGCKAFETDLAQVKKPGRDEVLSLWQSANVGGQYYPSSDDVSSHFYGNGDLTHVASNPLRETLELYRDLADRHGLQPHGQYFYILKVVDGLHD